MEQNLFQQAKELWENFIDDNEGHEGHAHTEQDKEAVREAIQAAYHDASPEEQQQLEQLEQHLEEKFD